MLQQATPVLAVAQHRAEQEFHWYKRKVLVQEYSEDAHKRGDFEIAKTAEALRNGLMRTPCDVVHRPASMLGAIRRVQAGIPPRTPYIVLERARKDLQRAQEQLMELDVGDDELLLQQERQRRLHAPACSS
jgi:hypothetical protein